jgi:hypothetical protein
MRWEDWALIAIGAIALLGAIAIGFVMLLAKGMSD